MNFPRLNRLQWIAIGTAAYVLVGGGAIVWEFVTPAETAQISNDKAQVLVTTPNGAIVSHEVSLPTGWVSVEFPAAFRVRDLHRGYIRVTPEAVIQNIGELAKQNVIVKSEPIRIGDTMSALLACFPEDGIAISPNEYKPRSLEQNGSGEWIFQLQGRKRGEYDLRYVVAVVLTNRGIGSVESIQGQGVVRVKVVASTFEWFTLKFNENWQWMTSIVILPLFLALIKLIWDAIKEARTPPKVVSGFAPAVSSDKSSESKIRQWWKRMKARFKK